MGVQIQDNKCWTYGVFSHRAAFIISRDTFTPAPPPRHPLCEEKFVNPSYMALKAALIIIMNAPPYPTPSPSPSPSPSPPQNKNYVIIFQYCGPPYTSASGWHCSLRVTCTLDMLPSIQGRIFVIYLSC